MGTGMVQRPHLMTREECNVIAAVKGLILSCKQGQARYIQHVLEFETCGLINGLCSGEYYVSG